MVIHCLWSSRRHLTVLSVAFAISTQFIVRITLLIQLGPLKCGYYPCSPLWKPDSATPLLHPIFKPLSKRYIQWYSQYKTLRLSGHLRPLDLYYYLKLAHFHVARYSDKKLMGHKSSEVCSGPSVIRPSIQHLDFPACEKLMICITFWVCNN